MDDVPPNDPVEECGHAGLVINKLKNYNGQERYQARCPDCGCTGAIGASEKSATTRFKQAGEMSRIAPTEHQTRRRAIKPA